ncbi:hypothetical protein CgunFtcFv8_005777 [Champsocephalus gunnari]|uniref:Uncharacterized protein n=1 Tax=Champsocephalus gunnari TaxID=52237 RepID=A0AAN8HDK2_CHAGU|nr:hypothetical protein CgunFtcFv8_005777 [Champsocephalus gunnari]
MGSNAFILSEPSSADVQSASPLTSFHSLRYREILSAPQVQIVWRTSTPRDRLSNQSGDMTGYTDTGHTDPLISNKGYEQPYMTGVHPAWTDKCVLALQQRGKKRCWESFREFIGVSILGTDALWVTECVSSSSTGKPSHP